MESLCLKLPILSYDALISELLIAGLGATMLDSQGASLLIYGMSASYAIGGGALLLGRAPVLEFNSFI